MGLAWGGWGQREREGEGEFGARCGRRGRAGKEGRPAVGFGRGLAGHLKTGSAGTLGGVTARVWTEAVAGAGSQLLRPLKESGVVAAPAVPCNVARETAPAANQSDTPWPSARAPQAAGRPARPTWSSCPTCRQWSRRCYGCTRQSRSSRARRRQLTLCPRAMPSMRVGGRRVARRGGGASGVRFGHATRYPGRRCNWMKVVRWWCARRKWCRESVVGAPQRGKRREPCPFCMQHLNC